MFQIIYCCLSTVCAFVFLFHFLLLLLIYFAMAQWRVCRYSVVVVVIIIVGLAVLCCYSNARLIGHWLFITHILYVYLLYYFVPIIIERTHITYARIHTCGMLHSAIVMRLSVWLCADIRSSITIVIGTDILCIDGISVWTGPLFGYC